MNYFSKIRLGAWIVIILTAINLAALGTILYKYQKFNRIERHRISKDKAERGFKYFMQELKLTPDQEKFFCNSRKVFFDSSKNIFKAQEELRIKMIQELSKTNPDTALLYKISEDMGKHYILLKKNTIKHLLQFREVCTPEQRKKLDTIYNKLIRPEGPMGKHWNKRKPENNTQKQEPKP